MDRFPHHYRVSARLRPDEAQVVVQGQGLPALETEPPKEFGGSGERWSPETLLVAAVADCFLLSFRAVAGASRFEWHELDVSVEGKLDRVERKLRFTELVLRAKLRVPAASESSALRILHKAEESCLITNSLSASVTLEPELEVLD